MVKNKTANRILGSLLLVGVFFCATRGYSEEKTHDAALSVKAEKTQKQDKKRTTDEKPNVSVTTTIETETETCTLEITVENPAKQSDSYQLEWFFISQKDEGTPNEKLYIFGLGKVDIDLEGKAEITKTEVSKPFVYTKKSIDRTGPSGNAGSSQQTRGGDEYAGYIVLVKAGGQIIQKESNDARFLNDEWMAKCGAAAKTARPPPKNKKKP